MKWEVLIWYQNLFNLLFFAKGVAKDYFSQGFSLRLMEYRDSILASLSVKTGSSTFCSQAGINSNLGNHCIATQIQCGAAITRSTSFKILTGELLSVYYEFAVWFTFCCCRGSAVYKIVINQTAL